MVSHTPLKSLILHTPTSGGGLGGRVLVNAILGAQTCLPSLYISLTNTHPIPSLGARPSINRKGGSGTSAGSEVYTAEC